MGRNLLYESKHFKLIKNKKDCIVKRKDDLYNHSHFKRVDHAIKFMNLLEKKIIPYSTYWKVAAHRLLLPEELKDFSHQKHNKFRFKNHKIRNK